MTSIKIGVALQYLIALQVAIKVSDCVITSVFSSAPDIFKQICNPDVPLTVAIAYLLNTDPVCNIVNVLM